MPRKPKSRGSVISTLRRRIGLAPSEIEKEALRRSLAAAKRRYEAAQHGSKRRIRRAKKVA